MNQVVARGEHSGLLVSSVLPGPTAPPSGLLQPCWFGCTRLMLIGAADENARNSWMAPNPSTALRGLTSQLIKSPCCAAPSKSVLVVAPAIAVLPAPAALVYVYH